MKLLLVLVMSLFLFSGCNSDKDTINENIGVSENIVSKENKDLTKAIVGEWLPTSAKGKDGEEISLMELWGSSINYGGTLKINEDDTYAEYIGVYAETEPLEGNLEVSDGNIVLKSKTGNIKNVTLIDGDTLEVNYGDFFENDEYKECIVSFRRVKN